MGPPGLPGPPVSFHSIFLSLLCFFSPPHRLPTDSPIVWLFSSGLSGCERRKRRQRRVGKWRQSFGAAVVCFCFFLRKHRLDVLWKYREKKTSRWIQSSLWLDKFRFLLLLPRFRWQSSGRQGIFKRVSRPSTIRILTFLPESFTSPFFHLPSCWNESQTCSTIIQNRLWGALKVDERTVARLRSIVDERMIACCTYRSPNSNLFPILLDVSLTFPFVLSFVFSFLFLSACSFSAVCCRRLWFLSARLPMLVLVNVIISWTGRLPSSSLPRRPTQKYKKLRRRQVNTFPPRIGSTILYVLRQSKCLSSFSVEWGPSCNLSVQCGAYRAEFTGLI